MGKDNIQLFEDQKIRTAWDEEIEEWYFSIVDVVAVLTESKNPAAYWRKLKQRLKEEGNENVTNCHGLKMTAADGKKRITDVATTEQLLRIIQSIPSPKAEPFKLWLAEVGRERIEETIDPEQAIDRALETYQKKGYSDEWIHQRLLSIRVRNALTDEWQKNGVQQGREYAILTDEITRAWSGMSTRQYKNLKGLKKENLRDNMSDMEPRPPGEGQQGEHRHRGRRRRQGGHQGPGCPNPQPDRRDHQRLRQGEAPGAPGQAGRRRGRHQGGRRYRDRDEGEEAPHRGRPQRHQGGC